MMREPTSNRLLGFLRSTYRAIGEAHRTNPRHDATSLGRLCWESAGRSRTVRCRLIDISRAGAALITAVEPPRVPRAMLRLKDREDTPWLEAEVLGSEPIGKGRHRVRIKFADPCPDFFLRVAVLGPVGEDEAEGEVEASEHPYAAHPLTASRGD